VGELTPLQSFVGGIAFGLTAMTVLVLFLWRAVVVERRRRNRPVATPAREDAACANSDVRRLIERIEALEARLAEMEQLMSSEIKS
jgi:hypothetical protein